MRSFFSFIGGLGIGTFMVLAPFIFSFSPRQWLWYTGFLAMLIIPVWGVLFIIGFNRIESILDKAAKMGLAEKVSKWR